MEPFNLPSLNGGIDQLGIVGAVAPGIFAQPGRCWRMVYVNVAGHASHCDEPVEWRGRYRYAYATGWKPVWSVREARRGLGWGQEDGGLVSRYLATSNFSRR
jgi:hypothetical protein